jgi:predicted house-cleaning NTP pyrophosphatase (Maf/HAM1 superfamily)
MKTLPVNIRQDYILEMLKMTATTFSQTEHLECLKAIQECYSHILGLSLVATVDQVTKPLDKFQGKIVEVMCCTAVSHYKNFDECLSHINYALEPFLWQVATPCEWKIPQESGLGNNFRPSYSVSIGE